MKKVFFLATMCLMTLTFSATVSCVKNDDESDNNASSGGNDATMYVDLGLPSGTKWKIIDEEDWSGNTEDYRCFTYDEAIAKFGDKLPSKEQWKELLDECEWENDLFLTTFEFVGPNGKSIIFEDFTGYVECDGEFKSYAYKGRYWSSTPYGSENAWACYLEVNYWLAQVCAWTEYYSRCHGFRVRLVQD